MTNKLRWNGILFWRGGKGVANFCCYFITRMKNNWSHKKDFYHNIFIFRAIIFNIAENKLTESEMYLSFKQNTVTQCRLLQSYFPYATIRHFLKTVFKYNVLPETLSRGPSDLTLTSMWDCPGMAWSSGLFSPLPRDTSEAIPWK